MSIVELDAPASTMATSVRAAIGLISEIEMAAILQVSKQTLATWRCKRKGPPCVRLGKRVFYPASDFSSWIGDQQQAQQDAPPKVHRVHKPKPAPNSSADVPMEAMWSS